LRRTKLASLLDTQPAILCRATRAIARFANEMLHRSGMQSTGVMPCIFETRSEHRAAG
jgi:hypothetical protein